MSKHKGKRGEQELSNILLGIDPGLNSRGDVHSQGSDLLILYEGTPCLSIEIKRHETLAFNSWWQQAARQAGDHGAIPVVAYRQNRKPWKFLLPASLLVLGIEGYLEINLEVFTHWYKRVTNC